MEEVQVREQVRSNVWYYILNYPRTWAVEHSELLTKVEYPVCDQIRNPVYYRVRAELGSKV